MWLQIRQCDYERLTSDNESSDSIHELTRLSRLTSRSPRQRALAQISNSRCCKEINDLRALFEYLRNLLVKDIFSTINLRIFTYLSLYNIFTLSHIHNSLYLICRTLRAHNFNRSQKEMTIRRYSKKILCSFRQIIIAASRWHLFLKICKKMKSCRMI